MALLRHVKFKYLLPFADAYMPKQNTLPMCDEIDDATNTRNERHAFGQPMTKEESYTMCANGMNILNKVKQMKVNEELTMANAGEDNSAPKILGKVIYLWLFQKLSKCLKETDPKQ